MSVTAAAQSVFDRAFENPLFSKAAVYTPPGEDAESVACRVLVGRSDATVGGMIGRPVARGGTLEVRKSEIAAPVKGGTFVITGGDTVTVADAPRTEDDERLVWTMTVS